MRLTTLDLIAATMDRPRRPLDWAIVLHLGNPPTLEMLRRGAISARLAYPSSASTLMEREWRRADVQPQLEAVAVHDGSERDVIHRFVDTPMDITRTPPVSQQLITTRDATLLVTRVHHAAADLIGGTLWLRHQLEVALGLRGTRQSKRPYAPPALRTHADVRRKSTFSYLGPSSRLAHHGSPSSARRWTTVAISATALRHVVQNVATFTYNDLLATCALETYRNWNAKRSGDRKIGLWMPTNIRKTPLDGFGNGTSRMRVYNRYDDTASLLDKARAVRAQIQWSRTHGEWALPDLQQLEGYPMWLLKPLLRAYFNRPWVDMGTGAFSHAERSPLDGLPPDSISKVELMGTLDPRHPFGIFALTLGATTYVSLVRDPAMLNEAEAAVLTGMFTSQLQVALSEI